MQSPAFIGMSPRTLRWGRIVAAAAVAAGCLASIHSAHAQSSEIEALFIPKPYLLTNVMGVPFDPWNFLTAVFVRYPSLQPATMEQVLSKQCITADQGCLVLSLSNDVRTGHLTRTGLAFTLLRLKPHETESQVVRAIPVPSGYSHAAEAVSKSDLPPGIPRRSLTYLRVTPDGDPVEETVCFPDDARPKCVVDLVDRGITIGYGIGYGQWADRDAIRSAVVGLVSSWRSAK